MVTGEPLTSLEGHTGIMCDIELDSKGVMCDTEEPHGDYVWRGELDSKPRILSSEDLGPVCDRKIVIWDPQSIMSFKSHIILASQMPSKTSLVKKTNKRILQPR